MQTIISKDIEVATQILERGDIIAIPTETVYGLAGNIFDDGAIRKIFALKQRPLFNPLIVHIPSINNLNDIVEDVPIKANKLADAFWPGPLTLILKKKSAVPDLVTAGKPTVAVRIPNHPLTLQLLENLNFPLAAPSANPFGSISPTTPSHVFGYFSGKLPMVLDGGNCERGIESTIIGFENDEPIVYRLGSIALEEIEVVVGPVKVRNKKESTPTAPGMLSRHYAPNTPTHLVEDVSDFIAHMVGEKIGVVLFKEKIKEGHHIHQIVLSDAGNLEEATSRLYAALHYLDGMDLDLIVAEKFPDEGLGKSINDRLERATKQK
ncbi:MAG: threonylcarbamoyl-AMP synthase [Saprospiraceae bacterium]|nr:threonylcarbamoyl-AMP synthase [Saprospiraceae bacterium]